MLGGGVDSRRDRVPERLERMALLRRAGPGAIGPRVGPHASGSPRPTLQTGILRQKRRPTRHDARRLAFERGAGGWIRDRRQLGLEVAGVRSDAGAAHSDPIAVAVNGVDGD